MEGKLRKYLLLRNGKSAGKIYATTDVSTINLASNEELYDITDMDISLEDILFYEKDADGNNLVLNKPN